MAPEKRRYDAFISYSHAADGRLAPALLHGLSQFAKPLLKFRALRVFHDQADLGVSPQLWPRIESALLDSDHLILLASPEAAASKWVAKELDTWLATHDASSIMFVLTGGSLEWQATSSRFAATSTALPPRIIAEWREEPLWLDLRWAQSSEDLSLRNGRFRDAVCRLSATLRNTSPAQLDGEDVRLYRRSRRLMQGFTTAIVILAAGLAIATYQAVQSRLEAERQAYEALRQKDLAEKETVRANEQTGVANAQRTKAEEQANIATSRQLAASALVALNRDPEEALRLAMSAAQPLPTTEAEDALRQGLSRLSLRRRGRVDGVVTQIHVVGQDALVQTRDALFSWSVSRPGRPRQIAPSVKAVRLSRDRTRLAVATDKAVHLYSLPGPRWVSKVDVSGISMDFSSDNRSLLIVAKGGVVSEWRLGSSVTSLRPMFTAPNAWYIAVPNQDGVVAVAGGDQVVLWRLDAGPSLALTPPQNNVYARLEFAPNDRLLLGYGATDTRHAGVWVWDDPNPRQIVGFSHSDTVTAAAFSPNGEQIATGDFDGHTRIYEAGSAKLLHELPNHMGSVNQVTFSPRGEFLLSVSNDQTARLWDIFNSRQVAQLLGHTGGVRAASFDADGRFIVTGGSDGDVRLWEIVGANPERVVPACQRATGAYSHMVNQDVLVSFPPGANLLQTKVADKIAWWNRQTGRGQAGPVSRPGRTIEQSNGVITAKGADGAVLWRRTFTGYLRAVIPGDRWVIVSPDSGGSQILDAATGEQAGLIASSIDHGWLSPLGDRLISEGGLEMALAVWDLPSGRPAGSLGGHSLRGFGAEFSPDGRFLVTWAADQIAIVRDARTLEDRGVLRGHNGPIRAAAFSHDGRYIATASQDRTVRVWEREAGRALLELRGHDAAATSVAFAPDDSAIVTGGADCRALIYRWDLDGSLSELKAMAQRRLDALKP